MKKLEFFLLRYCPYCIEAKRMVSEFIEQHPEYADIVIEEIDEAVEVDRAYSRDYYYVPAFFIDGIKLHEGAASAEDIRRVIMAAAKRQG